MLNIVFMLLERVGLSVLAAWLQRNKIQRAIHAQNKVASESDIVVDDELQRWTRE